MKRSQYMLLALAGIALLPSAQGFSILPGPHVTTKLRAATLDAPAKKEKVTKEAQELLDVFHAREAEEKDRPHLIVAQVAPSGE